MKLHLRTDGRRVPLRLPAPDAPCLLADEPLACPCAVPVHVVGIRGTEQVTGHDTEVAAARCYCCHRPLGQLELKHETLFGVGEDRAVMARGRVYDGTG